MDERSQEELLEERTGSDSLFTRLYRPGPLIILFTVAFLGLAGLGYSILTETPPPPDVVAEVAAVEPPPLVYEEETTSDMEDMVKQADLAIIQTMRSAELDMKELDLVDVEIRQTATGTYHYQVLQLPTVKDRNTFYKALQSNLASRIPEAKLSVDSADGLAIAINTTPTHKLMLAPIPLTLPQPEKRGPELAIVIDDIGQNMTVLKGLVNLDFPVTLAVWPNASFTRQSVELIAEKRHDLIIHFPMEPKGYPQYNPGDDALFTNMTKEKITVRIKENLARIPEAIGVNNHMGSRFTGYAPGMQVALGEFKKHGLFFLDSLTSGQSVGRATAKQVGIPFYERDIFIDNVKDVSAIVLQLKKAENVAKKKGHSIAIGHPYPETLTALKVWAKSRNRDIILRPLSKLPTE